MAGTRDPLARPLRERLAALGTLPAPEALDELGELARHLLHWGMGDATPRPQDRAILVDALQRLTGARRSQARAAIELATEPEHRPVTDLHELDSFASRFGLAAAHRLREEATPGAALVDWARSHDVDQAADLLECLVDIASRRGHPETAGLRRLVEAAGELGLDELLLFDMLRARFPVDAAPIELEGDRLSVGRDPSCALFLADPRVAAHHCDLVRTADGWRVVDAGSGRPTLVNGQPVEAAPLLVGASLGVGPYTLRLQPDGRSVTIAAPAARQVLSCHNLERRIGRVVLLDDVSFSVVSGEVIAVVGPSGAGKTTLLNAITGIAAADRGTVTFDGQDFHAVLERDRSLVGTVPQDDIVHPELRVGESLRYSAELRLPADARRPDWEAAVDRVLDELDIAHIRDSRIGDTVRRGISGGQRKRVNLGQELLTRSTSILFLDEPTSGLDPRSAQEIVRLVRQLADRGRIVFLVTHDLTPQVMGLVDHLMVLVPGGRLAWFGPPADAARYFGVSTPDAIFHRLDERSPEVWAQAWRDSPECRRRVHSRQRCLATAPDGARSSVAIASTRRRGPLGQLGTLIRRYARVKTRDRTGLWVLGAQPPFLAAVMATVFPAPTSEMIFMLTLSCLWFGMSAAVRELISDRAVWRRERMVGVGVLPYVGSRIAVLGLLSIVQCAALSLATWAWFDLDGYGFDPAHLAGTSALVGVCGMALGLWVSATFSSSEAAVGSLPLLLIPQISFSALLVNLRDMRPLSRALSWADPLRYAFEAMLKVGDRIARPTYVPGKWESRSFTSALYDYGYKGAGADDLGLEPPVLVGALGAFTVAFLVATVVIVWRRRES
ncbi:MAG: ATP-binding cassette domain-containing protein [Deltaproteobacteria bacterium]|nr:MAG: ATP-binding cassette domain-containing protein [Deltaproteobacteria bacterium]